MVDRFPKIEDLELGTSMALQSQLRRLADVQSWPRDRLGLSFVPTANSLLSLHSAHYLTTRF